MEVAVVFHSRFGHTQKLAESIAHGVSGEGVSCYLASVDDLDWDRLDRAAGMILGAPTYMGSASAEFKSFMDATSLRWLNQAWRDKVAAGFTNSYGMSGDKLNVLIQLAVFATQHGMLWVGQTEMNQSSESTSLNRLGSHLGLMAQSDNAPAHQTPPSGDLQTAVCFGARVAKITRQFYR
ncbi:MAG: flavodoxin family protein [Pseudomonadales bacterium]|nr:flavodoxin family protein [Pseudomonadales bacterium]